MKKNEREEWKEKRGFRKDLLALYNHFPRIQRERKGSTLLVTKRLGKRLYWSTWTCMCDLWSKRERKRAKGEERKRGREIKGHNFEKRERPFSRDKKLGKVLEAVNAISKLCSTLWKEIPFKVREEGAKSNRREEREGRKIFRRPFNFAPDQTRPFSPSADFLSPELLLILSHFPSLSLSSFASFPSILFLRFCLPFFTLSRKFHFSLSKPCFLSFIFSFSWNRCSQISNWICLWREPVEHFMWRRIPNLRHSSKLRSLFYFYM